MTNKMHSVTFHPDGAQTVSVDCVEVQPVDYEFNLRGFLAAKLLCWHRLTEAEAQNLLQVFEAAMLQEPRLGLRPSFGSIGSRDVDIAAAQKAWDKALPVPPTPNETELLQQALNVLLLADAQDFDEGSAVITALKAALALPVQPAPESDARQILINALVASKGWTQGYATAFVDDYASQPAKAKHE